MLPFVPIKVLVRLKNISTKINRSINVLVKVGTSVRDVNWIQKP